jgi:methyl-accepting chemotaxis protein
MRLVPLTAVGAAIILIPLSVVANGLLARSLHLQVDSRLETVAKRYAALAQVVATAHPGGTASVVPDSALQATLDGIFATGSVSEIGVELVDSSGSRLIASSGSQPGDEAALATAVRVGEDSAFTFVTSGGNERGAVATANLDRWVVLAHESARVADTTYRQVRTALAALAVILFLILVAIGYVVDRLVNRRIRGPAMQLATLAEAVAGGNLTVDVEAIESTDEVERLARALGTMVNDLRRLVRALSRSADDTSTMSTEITASSEQMSSSAAQIAQTASDLSAESGTMAVSIQELSASAVQLAPLAERMNAGAHEGVARNARLRDLALENRRLMDDSSAALATLAADVDAGAASVRQLVDASQEIRTFVNLVQSLARNSKLLALNAAMEAARAGDQGEGFSVVAAEVRRLSAMSSEAAERTQRVVAEVLAGVEASSQNTERMAGTARAVRRATEQGSESFAQLEASVAELEAWTAAIESTATGTNTLVSEITGRLAVVARGTESFAAAMQQVAAASEQQSASTQEIAAAAQTMAHAAERVSSLVANLRVSDAG